MTLSLSAPAPDWRYPPLLEIGQPSTIGIRLRSGGVVITPTSGNVTVTSPAGVVHLAAAALTVGTTSTAVVPATTPTVPEEGWITDWSIVYGGITYTYRQSALLVGSVPANLVSDEDFRPHVPELLHAGRIPEGQTDWSPQILAARDDILHILTSAGRKPWLTVDSTDFRPWLLALSLSYSCGAIVSEDAYFADKASEWASKANNAAALCRLTYAEAPTIHVGQGVVRCGATGRPRWL